MSSTAKRICAITASLIWAAALFPGAGCGGRNAAPLDTSDPSVPVAELSERAAERSEGASNAARRFAPEMLKAGAHLVAMSRETADEAEARELIARADAYIRGAEEVADAVQSARTLRFPADRSIGVVSVSPWGSLNWRELGPAQGNVTVEAEMMVYLNLARDAGDADAKLLPDLGPGAIQYLAVGDSAVTPEGLSVISEIRGLRDLSLSRMDGLTDGHLPLVADMLALRHLNLMGTPLTDEGIAALTGMPALEEIGLQGPGITDRSAYLLSGMPSLVTFLNVQTNLTDVGVEYLARHGGLRRLWLSGRAITDQSFDSLAGMKSLKELALMTTSVRGETVNRLRQALPECSVDTTS